MFDIHESPAADRPVVVVKVGDTVCMQSVGMEGVGARVPAAIGKVMTINAADGSVEVELSSVPADGAEGTEATFAQLGLPSRLQSLPRQRVRVPQSQVSQSSCVRRSQAGRGLSPVDRRVAAAGLGVRVVRYVFPRWPGFVARGNP